MSRGGAVAVALLLGGAALAARQATFRAGVQTVALYATVSDREGRLVPDLEREAFEVRDDPHPLPAPTRTRTTGSRR